MCILSCQVSHNHAVGRRCNHGHFLALAFTSEAPIFLKKTKQIGAGEGRSSLGMVVGAGSRESKSDDDGGGCIADETSTGIEEDARKEEMEVGRRGGGCTRYHA